MTESDEKGAKLALGLTPEKAREIALEAIARYQELAVGLHEARTQLYSTDHRPADRTRAFLHATAAVVQFLQRTSFFKESELDEAIVQLLFELQTVANGTPSEDFSVRPGKRTRGVRHGAFQVECALAVDNYLRAGLNLKEACQHVVRWTGASVAPDTIKDWRNDLSNTKMDGEAGRRYRSLRDEYSKLTFSIGSINRIVTDVGKRFKDLNLKSQANPVRDRRKQSESKVIEKPPKKSPR